MKFILSVLMVVFASSSANAENIRPKMHLLASDIVTLLTILQSEQEFINPKNEKKIIATFNNLDSHMLQVKKDRATQNLGMKVSVDFMQQVLADSRRRFLKGDKPSARESTQESLHNCITCHARGATTDFALPEVDLSKLDSYRQANFFFATRQFEKGKLEYEYTVAKYPVPVGEYTLRKALSLLLQYYIKIKADPVGGAAYFKKISENSNLPEYIRLAAKDWVDDFNKWSNEAKNDSELNDQQKLEKVKELLKPELSSIVLNETRRFNVRKFRAEVLLYKILESPPEKSPLKAEAIFYLGMVYGSDNPNFFQFRALFLKACISEYPKSSTAKKCYSALENIISDGNVGIGDKVPEKYLQELATFKALAY